MTARAIAAICAFWAIACPAATVQRVARHGNRVVLVLDRGAADLEFFSASTFRFRHAVLGDLPERERESTAALVFRLEDSPAALRFRTDDMSVIVAKGALSLRVQTIHDNLLLAQDEAGYTDGRVLVKRNIAGDAAYFGLGARTDPQLSLRGKRVETTAPFLISTTGYGLFQFTKGRHEFDFTDSGAYTTSSPGRLLDMAFYYGPAPKEILEEHSKLHPAPPDTNARVEAGRGGDGAPATWEALQAEVARVLNGGLSGDPLTPFRLDLFRSAGRELARRAAQAAALMPRVEGMLDAVPARLRRSFEAHFLAYAQEVRDRGLPHIHAMAMQFPNDPKAVALADQFFFGDELLAAPMLGPGHRRTLYLPQGLWTDLRTNVRHKGRQTIEVEPAPDEIPLFARNGAIVPLRAQDALELHYFPRLGGEYFLYEPDANDYTQAHAAPAAGIVRLEIESKVERVYRWIVHHAPRPLAIEAIGAKVDASSWDPKTGHLTISLRVRAGDDAIVNITPESEL